MSDAESTISCSTWQEIVGTLNKVGATLPLDMRKKLTQIFTHYLVEHGVEGAFHRLNNRTVAQIIEAYQPEKVRPIVSGEVDGVGYSLHEAPAAKPKAKKSRRKKGDH